MKNYTFSTSDKAASFTITFQKDAHMFGILMIDQNRSFDMYATSATAISKILKNSYIESPSLLGSEKIKVNLQEWSKAFLFTSDTVEITAQ